jgi:hypothetical protein
MYLNEVLSEYVGSGVPGEDLWDGVEIPVIGFELINLFTDVTNERGELWAPDRGPVYRHSIHPAASNRQILLLQPTGEVWIRVEQLLL